MCARRRPVGIAHAEVDDVLAAPARRHLQLGGDVEDVRRQALDAGEIFHGTYARVMAVGEAIMLAALTPYGNSSFSLKLHPAAATARNTFTGYGAGLRRYQRHALRRSLVVLPDRVVTDWRGDDVRRARGRALRCAGRRSAPTSSCSAPAPRSASRVPELVRPLVEARIGLEVMDVAGRLPHLQHPHGRGAECRCGVAARLSRCATASEPAPHRA